MFIKLSVKFICIESICIKNIFNIELCNTVEKSNLKIMAKNKKKIEGYNIH